MEILALVYIQPDRASEGTYSFIRISLSLSRESGFFDAVSHKSHTTSNDKPAQKRDIYDDFK